ncbi:amidohydrolase family protein [Streptacidiphilus griseoplanus]|uniref:amidohydrolase family protein n=1 Tax=Peterkaempfera griseoplana TaxID=66896 RepID=UPI0006E2A48F|nr:amidohydrolase family protein [Peterkaempfera griseoplana]
MTAPEAPAGPSPQPRVIDSHVHFWDPGLLAYPWLRTVPRLNRAFTPAELLESLPQPVEAVFVEAGRLPGQAAGEVRWVRELARTRPWIRGAVAHVSLDDPVGAPQSVRAHAADPFVVGVRHNVQDERPGFTAGADFRAGVALLGEAGLPFDACVREHQLDELADLAAACPRTLIVLDHLGKPSPSDPGRRWRTALRRLARRDNVVCKLSGLATEAAPGTAPETLLPVLREALQAFGPGRCLYGGDWPVMTLATAYGTWLDLVRTALADLPAGDADAVLHTNAARTYRLDREPPPARTPGAADPTDGRKEPA